MKKPAKSRHFILPAAALCMAPLAQDGQAAPDLQPYPGLSVRF